MNRRKFIRNSSFAGMSALAFPGLGMNAFKDIEVKKLTSGPNHHWFGYYDKIQMDLSGRYVLGMEADFCFRSPTADDHLKIGIIDLNDNNKWKEIGTSRSWGWQQGCMLQWRPGSSEEIVWNDRVSDRFVCKIYNLKSGETRIIPRAIYTLSPDGKFAICADFARINNMRVGYGYSGLEDAFLHYNAPKDGGIHKINLDTGEEELILSLEEVSQVLYSGEDISAKWHYFNHLLINPEGSRFVVLNRWREYPITMDIRRASKDVYAEHVRGKYKTRAFTGSTNGGDLYMLTDSGYFSHFIWKNNNMITAHAAPNKEDKRAFYEFTDKTQKAKLIGEEKMPVNGHNTYIPGTKQDWILNDTYPEGEKREQILYLYHVPTDQKIILGKFHEPQKYDGEWRCDLHPKCNDGKTVIFDSTHGGDGRQMYMMDISSLI